VALNCTVSTWEERILTIIAETVDGRLPRGENWHLLLLEQMMTEIPRVRPL